MDVSKNTCGCPNNYDTTTFMESFGKDENDMKKCNACPNLQYEDGIMNCKKFDERR